MPGKLKFVTICIRCNGRRSRKTTDCKKNKNDLANVVEVESLSDRVKMAAPQRIVLIACGSFNPITNMHLRMFEIARDFMHRSGRFQVVGGVISPVNDGYGKKDLVDGTHRSEMCKLALQHNNWIKLDTWELEQTTWLRTAKVMSHHSSKILDNKNNNTQSGLPLPLACVSASPTRRGVKRRRNDTRHTDNNLNRGGVKITNGIADSKQEKNNDRDEIYSTKNPIGLKLLCGADLLESFSVPGLWSDEDIETIVGRHGLVVVTRSGSDPHRFIYEHDLLYKYANNIHIVTEWIYNEISSTKIRRALRRNESIKYLVPEPVINYIHEHKLYQSCSTDSIEGKS